MGRETLWRASQNHRYVRARDRWPASSMSQNPSSRNMGRVKRKGVFEHAQKCADLDHPAHVLSSGFCSPSIHCYTMILLANSEGPDQTARMRRLIWAFAVRVCPKTRFRMAMPR